MIFAGAEYLSTWVAIVKRMGDNNRCACPSRTLDGRITRPRDTPFRPLSPSSSRAQRSSLWLSDSAPFVTSQRPDSQKRGISLHLYTSLLSFLHFNMSRATLNLLRFATSSLRTPAVSRSSYHSHRTATIASRTYSNTSSESSKETPKGPEDVRTKTEDKLDEVPPLSELEAKLQAKEAEVLDLTVRQFRRVST